MDLPADVLFLSSLAFKYPTEISDHDKNLIADKIMKILKYVRQRLEGLCTAEELETMITGCT
jgi:hypothetical protein